MRMNGIVWEEAIRLDPGAANRAERLGPPSAEGEARELWSRAVLQEVVETAIDMEMPYSSFEEYWSTASTGGHPVSSYIEDLSPEHRDKLRDALRNRHLAGRPDGPYSLPARAWAVKGRLV